VIESSLSMEPDTIFSQLPKLIEGWDPPSSMPAPSKQIQEAITIATLNGEISAVSLDESIQSDLDSHANMVVLGKHCFIISDSGKYIDVNAFADAVGGLAQVPIVDATITYDCPYGVVSLILTFSITCRGGGRYLAIAQNSLKY
jgi:hypothetical protein